MVDLCTRVARLLIGILAYLLVLAVIDHWVIGLTETMRLTALLALVLGCGVFFVRAVLPLFLHEVNPLFAAHTIEQAEPSLKNSLVNLILVSRRREGVRPVIFDGMQRQAAGQIANVDPETLVDRGPLIHAGYWLVGLLAIAACYKVLSPKDPLQTAARVAAPWKAIDRPARVSIRDVLPGNTELYRGQSLEVEATIRGLDEDEDAVLTYTTDDRQFVDQPLVLEQTGPSHFRGLVQIGERGLQQSLNYRITAGDAETSEFRALVKDAPHIEVLEVEYQFPSYTGLAAQKQVGKADLIAIEGTRVIIHGQSNQPIAEATIELFNLADDAGVDAVADQSLPMKHQGERAQGRMTLLLKADRKSPRSDAYQLRFTTADGHRNLQPTRHSIEVIPDLAPDVEILAPLSRDTELPEDRTLVVEIRALDPDFEVQQIRLLGATAGKELFDIATMEEPEAGQVVRKVKFTPRKYKLVAGDEVLIWAIAQDNRHDASGKLASNTRRTENYRIRIVAPSPKDRPDQGGEDSSEADGETSDESDSAEDQSSNEPGSSGDTESQDTGEGGSKESETAGESDGGDGETEAEPTEADGGQQGSSATQEQKDGAESSDQPNPGDGEAGESLDDANDSKPNSSEPTEDATGSDEGSSDGGSENQEPVASDGSNDSEAFERILRRQRQEQQDREDEPQASEGSSPNDTEADRQNAQSSPGSQAGDDAERNSEQNSGSELETKQDTDATEQESSQDTDATGRSPGTEEASEDTDDRRAQSENDRNETGEQAESEDNARREDASQDTDARPQDTDERANDTDGNTVGDADASRQNGDDTRETGQPDASAGEAPASDRVGAESESESSSSSGAGEKDQRGEQSGTEASQTEEESAPRQSNSDARGTGDNANAADDRQTDAEGGDESARETSGRSQDSPTSPGEGPGDPAAGRERAANPGQSASDDATQQDQASNREDPGTSDAGEKSGGSRESTSETGATRQGDQRNSDSARQSSNTGGSQDSTGRLGADNSTGSTASEDPNLEYSKKATDLALEYLKDHQDDAELLDELGWTRDEMNAFVRRWQDMRAKAQGLGREADSARKELDDQLRGLGLQPPNPRVQRQQTPKDSLRSLRQTSGNQNIPAEYRDQYRAFLRSVPKLFPIRQPIN